MKSSYIWRTFSSTTVLLVSFLSSSQASQNIIFSSLNSVRRNWRKQLRPAALFITFSNDVDQERASSRADLRLKEEEQWIFHVVSFPLCGTACDGFLGHCVQPIPFFTIDGSLCCSFTSRLLYCLILIPNSQTGRKKKTHNETGCVLIHRP